MTYGKLSSWVLLLALALLAQGLPVSLNASTGWPPPGVLVLQDSALSEKLARALRKGSKEEIPYHLIVDCLNEKGPRSLEVFTSGVAIFGGKTEVRLKYTERSVLLQILSDSSFASLRESYGGKDAAQNEQGPMRVSCRVDLEIEGLQKSSIQLADGAQSDELAALAAALLDRVEPVAEARGESAEGLSEGLDKLAEGQLSAYSLLVRFVELGSQGREPGTILRIQKGTLSIQSYHPGQQVGEPSPLEFEAEALAKVVKALQDARVESFPLNLWASRYIDLEVRVLNHGKSMTARNFSRLSPDKLGETQKRFDRLVEALRALRSSSSAN